MKIININRMIVELIIGISSFFGGGLMTISIVKMVNYWRTQRELERRTLELYNSFVDDDDLN